MVTSFKQHRLLTWEVKHCWFVGLVAGNGSDRPTSEMVTATLSLHKEAVKQM
jgi:hypothetical protein